MMSDRHNETPTEVWDSASSKSPPDPQESCESRDCPDARDEGNVKQDNPHKYQRRVVPGQTVGLDVVQSLEGTDQDEEDRGRSDCRFLFYHRLLMRRREHPPGPGGVEDREVQGYRPRVDTSCYWRLPAPPPGPRSSDHQEGDQDTSDVRPGYYLMYLRRPKVPEGREADRADGTAADHPPFQSHESGRRRRTTPARPRASKLQERAKDVAAEHLKYNWGSSTCYPVPPRGPRVAQIPKKESDDDKDDGYATAQGHRRHMPDQPRGRPVWRLPPLRRAPAVGCRLGPSSSPRASHLPGSTLATAPEDAPLREPGARNDVLNHPALTPIFARPRLPPIASAKPRVQDAQGLRDAGHPRNRPRPRPQASAPKDLHCRPRAPPPEAHGHKHQRSEGKNEKGSVGTPAQPGEKPSTSNEDPTTTFAE